MEYENERVMIRKEEKNLGLSLMIGSILGTIIGMIFKNIILGFSLSSILGIFIGSVMNIINRNEKISK